MPSLKRDFLDLGLELRETHISLVFLTEDAVFKVKKPVQLGFLDFSTREKRKHSCDSEVVLNQRLSPGVYRGVVPIALDASGRHRIGAAGEPVEWAVEMRRLPDAHAADQRLRQGRLGRDDLRRVAERLARFHAAARCDEHTSQYGTLSVIAANVRENFEQTRDSSSPFIGREELLAIERWQLAFLHEQRARFEARIAHGRIRDGHGDLRLEHCYLDDQGGVDIIDCIEFNDRFRYGDVCADVAFLSMDLLWHERHDLSEAFLADYARAANDYDLYGVVDFYESYRAHVRAKVSSMLLADPSADTEARTRAAAQTRKYYLLAEACTREPLEPPALYAVGGVIGSGKSTVAEQLGTWLAAPVIDADRTRKGLAGVDQLTPLPDAAFSGRYGADATAGVYAELLRRAEVVLESKRTVILDASFRQRDHRLAALALARRFGIPFLFIECGASLDVCRARLIERAKGPAISDGRLDVFDAFVASFQPVTELPGEVHVRVDTSRPLDETLTAVRSRLASPPRS